MQCSIAYLGIVLYSTLLSIDSHHQPKSQPRPYKHQGDKPSVSLPIHQPICTSPIDTHQHHNAPDNAVRSNETSPLVQARTCRPRQSVMRRPAHAMRPRMTASLMPLHVTPHTKRLSAPRMRTLEGLLASMRVTVDLQTRRPAKCLVASRANITVLGLRIRRLRRSADVVVVLPGVASRHVGCALHGNGLHGSRGWWEI